jgi:hypothetical protein
VHYIARWLALFPYNPKGSCFPRALALNCFARRYGFAVQFQCGVMMVDQHLEGHAWVMLDGREFFEPSSYWRSFTVTVRFHQTPVSFTNRLSDSPEEFSVLLLPRSLIPCP